MRFFISNDDAFLGAIDTDDSRAGYRQVSGTTRAARCLRFASEILLLTSSPLLSCGRRRRRDAMVLGTQLLYADSGCDARNGGALLWATCGRACLEDLELQLNGSPTRWLVQGAAAAALPLPAASLAWDTRRCPSVHHARSLGVDEVTEITFGFSRSSRIRASIIRAG